MIYQDKDNAQCLGEAYVCIGLVIGSIGRRSMFYFVCASRAGGYFWQNDTSKSTKIKIKISLDRGAGISRQNPSYSVQ